MPFDPSRIKPPQIDPDRFPGATRDDKVMALANKLYERGLASTKADAKRLAEGMVETERKVVKQMSPEPTKPLRAADIPRDASVAKASTAALDLSEQFLAFVDKVAQLPAESIATQAGASQTPRPSYPVSKPVPVSFGREELKPVASVPHAQRASQMFFDEAPDLTKLRGYTGPKRNPVEYTHEKLQELKRPVPLSSQATAAGVTEVIRVSTGDGAVKVTKTDVAQNVQIVEETMIIEDVPMVQTAATTHRMDAAPTVSAPVMSASVASTSVTSTPPASDPVRAPTPVSSSVSAVVIEDDIEDLPEKTVELPKPEKPRVQEDLAKKHGVDIFEMFKKKG